MRLGLNWMRDKCCPAGPTQNLRNVNSVTALVRWW